ncbi:hypothetical protein C8Q70DRAFT_912724, partial [Cubamyces menziesii]
PYKATQDLASCSLVCRCWSPVAQAMLYRDVALTLERRSPGEFLAFLQSTPHIASLVRCLLVHKNTGSLGREHVDHLEGRGHDGECPALLVSVIGALPALSHLEFAEFLLLGWPRDIPMTSQSINLAHLTLSRLSYNPISDPDRVPFDILSLFDIGRLVLDNNSFAYSIRNAHISNLLVRTGSGLPAVRELVFPDYDCFIEYNLKCGGLSVEHIRLLSITWSDTTLFKYAGLLINRYGAYATDIHLNICQAAGYKRSHGVGFWEPFSLAACTRIQRLRLSWQHSYLVRVPNEGYSEAYEAVLASTPPTLRELDFDFTAPLSDELRLTAPHVAQRIVQAAARFPGLGKVTLSILRPLTVGECTAVMSEFLPRGIVDRGLVRVEQKDGLCKCFSRYALPYVMQWDFSHHVLQNLLTGSYTEWPSAIEQLTFSVFLL